MFAKDGVPLFVVTLHTPADARVLEDALDVRLLRSSCRRSESLRLGRGQGLLLEEISTVIVSADPAAVDRLRSSGTETLANIVEDGEIPAAGLVQRKPLQPVPGFDEREFCWHLQVTKVKKAHRAGLDGSGVKVGVLDSGLCKQHTDFRNRPNLRLESFITRHSGQPFPADQDDYGHGTAVSGLAAGPAVTALGSRYGVAPGCSLFSARVARARPQFLSAVVEGLNAAVAAGCQIVNLSMSIAANAPQRSILEEAIKRITDRVLVIAAAGNYGSDPVGVPASLHNVKAVGFVNTELAVHPNSPAGQPGTPAAIDVVAPGELLTTAANHDDVYVQKGLSSMATPQVTGIAALWWQHLSASVTAVTPQRVWQAIVDHADPKAVINFSPDRCGAGLVQAPTA